MHPSTESVHALFADEAMVSPSRVAIREGNLSITYRELDRRANRLAHHLAASGAGPEERIAVLLPRGIDAVVAMLGILKAGAAYVPLDPGYPRDRLATCLEVAGARRLVSDSTHRIDGLGDPERAVLLDRDADAIAAAGETAPDLEVGPDRLLYVVFTSGTTGRPKGVMVEHGNVARLFEACSPYLELTGRTLSHCHSPAFGFAQWEIWGALLHGGTLVVAGESEVLSPPHLLDRLEADKVDMFSLTPTGFRAWLLDPVATRERIARLPLRTLVLSGEAPVHADLARWFERHGDDGPEILSSYALVETAGQVAWTRLGPAQVAPGAPRLLGRPVADLAVSLRAPDRDEPEAGEPGELVVTGPGVARGYLGDDGPGGFETRSGTRSFRTGDRARRLPDGSLELVGRADRQVKIRGQRVELDEVEAVLASHPGVKEVAVTLEGDGPAATLAAWVVAAGTGELPGAAPGAGRGNPGIWPAPPSYQVYDELLYHVMTSDAPRMGAYREAIRRLVPGKVVYDVGTGQDAILARFAAEAGARKVYATEILPDVYEKAKATVASLGLSDRIEVVLGDATSMRLPEPAEVSLQALIGNVASDDGVIPIMNAVRSRMVGERIQIPCRVETRMAAGWLPEDFLSAWRPGSLVAHYAERIFAKEGRRFDFRLSLFGFPSENLVSGAATFEDLDFTRAIEPGHRGETTLEIDREGRFDGLVLWTHLTAAPGATVDALEHQRVLLPAYFPAVWPAVPVAPGDRIELTWERRPSGQGHYPDFLVSGNLVRCDGSRLPFRYESLRNETRYRSTAIHDRIFAGLAGEGDHDHDATWSRSLRAHALARMPEAMVPSLIRSMPRLPRTATGKLDRGALGEACTARPGAEPGDLPEDRLEAAILPMWREVLGIARLRADEDFFQAGGSSIQAMQLTSLLRDRFRAPIYVMAVFEAPTPVAMAGYLRRHFPEAVGEADRSGTQDPGGGPRSAGVDEGTLDEVQRAVPRMPSRTRDPEDARGKNPRAVFLLSPPRSGSTLLRTMLAGHPGLFAPPELQLLVFETMDQRYRSFKDREGFWLEGTLQALMEAEAIDLEEARRRIGECESRAMSCKAFYRLLQEADPGRLLVDKTSYYALEPSILARAEEDFDRPVYLHLVRHPGASVHSFLEGRYDLFFRHPHRLDPPRLAEVIWNLCHRNILRFLEGIPEARQVRIRYEDLVTHPEETMGRVAATLGIPYDPAMADPYSHRERRMLDPIHPATKALGDTKILERKALDPSAIDRWRGSFDEGRLSPSTWDRARTFGYARRPSQPIPDMLPLVHSQRLFWAASRGHGFRSIQVLPLVVSIRGPLAVDALERALHGLLQRHPILASGVLQDRPMLRHHASRELRLGHAELKGPRGGRDHPGISAAFRRHLHAPFDLVEDTLVRATLVRQAPEEHVLLLAASHVVCDGYSIGVLYRDLVALYVSELTGTRPDLPACPPSFLAYMHERAQLAASEDQERIARERAGRIPESCRAWVPPAPWLSPEIPPHREPELVLAPLDASRMARVQAAAKASGRTPTLVLLALIQRVLGEASGQEEFLVDLPTTSQLDGGYQDAVGVFAELGLLRATSGLSWQDHLETLYREVLDNLAARGTRVRPLRKAFGQPGVLLDPLFPWNATRSAGATTFERIRIPHSSTHYPLAIYLTEHTDRTDVLWAARPRLVPRSAVLDLHSDLEARIDGLPT